MTNNSDMSGFGAEASSQREWYRVGCEACRLLILLTGNLLIVVRYPYMRWQAFCVFQKPMGKNFIFLSGWSGAVEALIGSIKQAMPYDVRLVELEVHSMFDGESASESLEGEAEVTIEVNWDMFIANGVDTDIAFAAAKAYLAACNQAVQETPQIVPQI